MEDKSPKFNIGDLVRDVFLLPMGADPTTLGIVTQVERGFYKKGTVATAPDLEPPVLQGQDKIHVSWTSGELVGREEEVPEWFLSLVSRSKK